MINLDGTVALTFWVVTLLNDLVNVNITNTWIDNDKLCFNAIIHVQFAQDGSAGWEIRLKSSHQLSSLNTSHANIKERAEDGFLHVLTNMSWNAQMTTDKNMEVSFLACTSKTASEPKLTAVFQRNKEICPTLNPPSNVESIKVLSVLENQWNDGFKGYLNITPPVTITHGWKIYLAFSRPLNSLDVPQAIVVPPQGDLFTLENYAWNRGIVGGTSLLIPYVGRKATPTEPTPCAEAIFTWKKVDENQITTPTPESRQSNTSPTPFQLTTSPNPKQTAISHAYPSTTAQRITTRNPSTTSLPQSCAPYNYSEVLHKSILFYEAQRSGKLPENNRISWRGDSALGDKGDGGEDLTGGWYDAGDFVKFGFPMAFSTTLLTWGLIEFPESYTSSHQMQNMLNSIKWPLDYFIKAHVNPEEFYGQVGNGEEDHKYWGRPEDMTMSRPAYKFDRNKPGSDLAAETAAAMAAGSIVFREENQTYANLLLNHSKVLYYFADQYRGKYSDSFTDASLFYLSSNYNDELVWGAAWLYKATKNESYLQKAEQYFTQFGTGNTAWAFSWDEKTAGVQMLLYELTGKSVYEKAIENSLDAWLPGGSVSYTPKGLAWRMKWGSNRYAGNTAFLALLASKKGLKSSTYRDFGKKQIHYMLGDTGRSYVVGFGNNPPTRPHHRSSSCPDRPASCGFDDANNPGPNPQILYGALVGGPDQNDFYEDKRDDYVKNEVACDYNAGFQSAVAALKSLDTSSCSTIPPPQATSLPSSRNTMFTTLEPGTSQPEITTSPNYTEPSSIAFSASAPTEPIVTTLKPSTNQSEITTNFNTELLKTSFPTSSPTNSKPTDRTLEPSTNQPQITTNPNTEPATTSYSTSFPTKPTMITLKPSTNQPEMTTNPNTDPTAFPDTPSTTQSSVDPHPCGDVVVPTGFNSEELPVVILQEWPQGFTGKITITAPAGVRNGWEIVFLLKNTLSLLEVFVATTTPSSGTRFTLKNKDYNIVLTEGSVTVVDFKATKENENDNVPCSRAVFLWAKEEPCPTIAPVGGFNSSDATFTIHNEWNEGLSGEISVVVPAEIQNGWQFRVIVSTPITLVVYHASSVPSTGTSFTLTNKGYNKSLISGSTLVVTFTGTKQEIGTTVLCASAIFLW